MQAKAAATNSLRTGYINPFTGQGLQKLIWQVGLAGMYDGVPMLLT